jgi:hypothetical protein
VLDRTGEPVEPGDHKHVPGAAELQGALQLRTPCDRGDALGEQLLDAVGTQGSLLRLQAGDLLGGCGSGVSDLRGSLACISNEAKLLYQMELENVCDA